MMIRKQIEAKMMPSEVHFMLFAQTVNFCLVNFSKELFVSGRKHIESKFKDTFRENFSF